MGGGASTYVAEAAQQNPELLHEYNQEFAALFAQQYAKYHDEGLSEEEAKDKFKQSLQAHGVSILKKIGQAKLYSEITPPPEAEMPAHSLKQIDMHIRRIQFKTGIKFLCCVDGSDHADKAFRTAMHLTTKTSSITMFHAFKDADQNGLAPIYKPEFIRSKYESQLIGYLPKEQYDFAWEERAGPQTVLRALQIYIERRHYEWSWRFNTPNTMLDHYKWDSVSAPHLAYSPPDFILLGHVGRKGLKSHQESAVGSTCSGAIRSLPIPCIICKKSINTGPLSYIMAIDNTENSKKGLDILLQLIKAHDTLTLIHIIPEDQPLSEMKEMDNMRQYYEADLSVNGPQQSSFKFVDIIMMNGESICDRIVNYVNDANPDFFAIAPRATLDLSSLTEHIIENISTSVIICRN